MPQQKLLKVSFPPKSPHFENHSPRFTLDFPRNQIPHISGNSRNPVNPVIRPTSVRPRYRLGTTSVPGRILLGKGGARGKARQRGRLGCCRIRSFRAPGSVAGSVPSPDPVPAIPRIRCGSIKRGSLPDPDPLIPDTDPDLFQDPDLQHPDIF